MKTTEILRELRQTIKQFRTDLRHIWQPRASGWRSDGNWYLSRRTALWLRMKATVCLVANRWNPDSYYLDNYDWFTLARYDYSEWSGEYGTHRGWTELRVAVKGWAIVEGSEGTP